MTTTETILEQIKYHVATLPKSFAEEAPLHLWKFSHWEIQPGNTLLREVKIEYASEYFCVVQLKFSDSTARKIEELYWHLKEQFCAKVAAFISASELVTGLRQHLVISDREKFYGNWTFQMKPDSDSLFRYVANSTLVFADHKFNF